MVTAPALIIDYDDPPWTSQGASLAGNLRGSRLVIRPGRSHPFYERDLEGLAKLIRAFLLEHLDKTPEAESETRTPSSSEAHNGSVPSGPNLSPRELEVLRLIADGKSNPEIAAELVIAPGTAGRHVSNLLAKTGLRNRTELATYAADQGLRADPPGNTGLS